MKQIIRAVQAEDWAKVKEIRLSALRDPLAPVAFLETYEDAAAKSDTFWQERTAGAAEGVLVRQFVAEDAAGAWLGTVSVLVERAGVEGVFGTVPDAAQTHIVGVFVRPEARGSGLAQELFAAALEWSWQLAEPRIERVRLFVHEDNPRAHALYLKAGFATTGFTVPVPGDAGRLEIELAVPRG
ncbi:GNAT family N-acetyltransferase [Kitasatospora sp. NBC_01560]|uniref:GNAT family N-acetyltransferase n=1 Tax=Kitasatospora sp. NBC_01560 TaxID=2975965 RepID=UPI0038684BD1